MDQGLPAPGQEPAPEAKAGGDVGQVIVETDKNLAMLAKAAGGGAMPPELAEGFAQVSEMFRSLVEQALQAAEGGAPAPQPKASPRPAAQGMAPQAAGGNPNVKPVV